MAGPSKGYSRPFAVKCLTSLRDCASAHIHVADAFNMYASKRASGSRATAQGSSLVELVVLFSLVGTISAFAIPRYTRLANEARATQVMALSGILRSVAKTAHQQYLDSGSKLETVNLEGKAVSLKNGYPEASGRGIRAVMTDWAGFTTQTTANSVIFMKKGAAVAEQCAVVYRVAELPDNSETLTKLAVAGC
jgi:type II secretory pathway pseudopilin PulG